MDRRDDLIYTWTPPAINEGYWDTPQEYAVVRVGARYGGCMVYGFFGQWHVNPSLRSLVTHLLEERTRLTAAIAELVKERDAAREAAVYLPGTWKCDACDFTLSKDIINAQTGEVGVDPDKKREACPNDGTLLRRVSYQEAFRDACDIGMKHAQDARQLEADLTASREEAKRLREALEPFVRAFLYVHRDPHADENNPGFREFLDGNEVIPRQMSSEEVLSVGHFRHAALAMESAALSAPAGSEGGEGKEGQS